MQNLGAETFKREFADSPKVIAYLDANFSERNMPECCALLEAADESSYSLRQWVEALIVLGHWLDAHKRDLSLTEQLGYISCACEAGSAAGPYEHLPSLVESLLEQHGCELSQSRL